MGCHASRHEHDPGSDGERRLQEVPSMRAQQGQTPLLGELGSYSDGTELYQIHVPSHYECLCMVLVPLKSSNPRSRMEGTFIYNTGMYEDYWGLINPCTYI